MKRSCFINKLTLGRLRLPELGLDLGWGGGGVGVLWGTIEDLCVRNRYLGHAQMITSHCICGVQLLIHAISVRFWFRKTSSFLTCVNQDGVSNGHRSLHLHTYDSLKSSRLKVDLFCKFKKMSLKVSYTFTAVYILTKRNKINRGQTVSPPERWSLTDGPWCRRHSA